MFTREETQLLLTEPLLHSPLWQKDDPARPRFDAELWGERGIESSPTPKPAAGRIWCS